MLKEGLNGKRKWRKVELGGGGVFKILDVMEISLFPSPPPGVSVEQFETILN